MKEILLTQGYKASVNDEDYENLIKYHWCGCRSGHKVEAVRGIRKEGTRTGTRFIKMAHVILPPGEGEIVEHIDGNRLNNQRTNLRLCTHQQNCYNRQKQLTNRGSSRYKGVSFHKKARKWVATISFQSIVHYLGLFETEEAAARSYDAAAKEYYQEYAKLNFPTNTKEVIK